MGVRKGHLNLVKTFSTFTCALSSSALGSAYGTRDSIQMRPPIRTKNQMKGYLHLTARERTKRICKIHLNLVETFSTLTCALKFHEHWQSSMCSAYGTRNSIQVRPSMRTKN